jgi:hypothetical protein
MKDELYLQVILLVWAAWLLARALPAQNVALILGVLIGCEFALEIVWQGRILAGGDLAFWPAMVVLARVACRWILRHWRRDWKYGSWLIAMASMTVALLQFVLAPAGSPWALAAKLASLRLAATAFCLFFLSPWFISKLPQQPHDHAQ